MLPRYFFASACLILQVGCSTNQTAPSALETDICVFNRAIPNSVITHIDNSGATVGGDLTNRVDVNYGKIASVLAKTKKSEVRQLSSGYGYCCQVTYFGYWCGYQFCQGSNSYDLAPIYGLARAPSLEDAEQMALENCEAAGKEFAAENGIKYSSYRFECEVKKKQWCY